MLRVFFPETGHSFHRGVHINHPDGGFVVTAIFAGFLQDLLGHKETTEWKGTNGVYCCLTCDNVVNMQHRRPNAARGEVAANCTNVDRFRQRTDADVYANVDELKGFHDADMARLGRVRKKPFGDLQTRLGFNYVPEGLLMDTALRRLYKPVSHTIRDWQHTLVQDGFANTHVALLLHRLKETCNISLDRIQTFSQMVHYPSSTGKLESSAFGKNRLKDNTITSFSSVMLSMIMVLHFFCDAFEVSAAMPAEVASFTKLYLIIGILRMGPEDAMEHVGKLRILIQQHLETYLALYDNHCKPKVHHLFHVPDGMEWVGKLLSCFVTER